MIVRDIIERRDEVGIEAKVLPQAQSDRMTAAAAHIDPSRLLYSMILI